MCIPKLADIKLIKREIEVIEELLELEPDSKCECHLHMISFAPFYRTLWLEVGLKHYLLQFLINLSFRRVPGFSRLLQQSPHVFV